MGDDFDDTLMYISIPGPSSVVVKVLSQCWVRRKRLNSSKTERLCVLGLPNIGDLSLVLNGVAFSRQK